MRLEIQPTTSESAYIAFAKLIEAKGHKLEYLANCHRNQHRFIRTNINNYYCLYKTEFFKTFADQFPEFKNKHPEYIDSKGESINIEALDKVIELHAILIFIYHSGLILQISADQFKQFAKEHNLIREQDKKNIINQNNYTGTKVAVKEITYCIPNLLLKEFN